MTRSAYQKLVDKEMRGLDKLQKIQDEWLAKGLWGKGKKVDPKTITGLLPKAVGNLKWVKQAPVLHSELWMAHGSVHGHTLQVHRYRKGGWTLTVRDSWGGRCIANPYKTRKEAQKAAERTYINGVWRMLRRCQDQLALLGWPAETEET
jgi:hypothetical protein